MPALALDGKAFTKVTHKTVPVSRVIYSNHTHLFLFSSFYHLRLPWFWETPGTDWALGKIMGWSTHCHALCLKSALPNANGAVLPAPSRPPISPTFLQNIMTSATYSVRVEPCLCLLTMPMTVPLTCYQGLQLTVQPALA